jgi:hypothetical protein
MQATHTFTILFWINKAKIKNGEAPIWARVTVDGIPAKISIKRSIYPAICNPEKGLAKGSKEETRMLNSYIEQVRNQLFGSYLQLLADKKLVTSEGIKNLYLGKGDKEHSLMSLIDYHNNEFQTTIEWVQ